MNIKSRGFSLIELMVTVAIVAIIASIAYPSYRKQVLRSNRAEALAALALNSQHMEKCYTNNGTYVGCATLKGMSEHNLYKVSEGTGANATTATTFRLTAEAQGKQKDDEECTSFSITQTGAMTAADSAPADTTATCLRK